MIIDKLIDKSIHQRSQAERVYENALDLKAATGARLLTAMEAHCRSVDEIERTEENLEVATRAFDSATRDKDAAFVELQKFNARKIKVVD